MIQIDLYARHAALRCAAMGVTSAAYSNGNVGDAKKCGVLRERRMKTMCCRYPCDSTRRSCDVQSADVAGRERMTHASTGHNAMRTS